MLAVKLANFLMFTVSRESTVIKCSEGCREKSYRYTVKKYVSHMNRKAKIMPKIFDFSSDFFGSLA